MATDLQGLAQVLESSLDPTKNKKGPLLRRPIAVAPQSNH